MSVEAMKQAYEVPLVEQLESVPKDARLVIDDADGMRTRFIPVGRMCHDAAKALRQAIEQAQDAVLAEREARLRRELEELREKIREEYDSGLDGPPD